MIDMQYWYNKLEKIINFIKLTDSLYKYNFIGLVIKKCSYNTCKIYIVNTHRHCYITDLQNGKEPLYYL